MLQNVNVKTRVRKKNKKIIIRLILLQLVLLAFASHYARAKIDGIIKYYLIELFGVLCIIYVLSCIKEKISNRRYKKAMQVEQNLCKVDEEVEVRPRTYNFNWIIKSENVVEDNKKEEVKMENTEKQAKKIDYQSPFEGTINTDKKVLYRSPFEPLHKKVVLILDSAREDFKYTLRYNMESKVFVRKKEKFRYSIKLLKDKRFTKKHEEFRYRLRKCVGKVFSRRGFRYKLRRYKNVIFYKKCQHNFCNFRPKIRRND